MATKTTSAKRARLGSDILVNGSLALLVLLWTIPTIGLLVSSFRTRFDIQTSGWWSILPHQEWMQTEEFKPDDSLDREAVMTIRDAQGTFAQFPRGSPGSVAPA